MPLPSLAQSRRDRQVRVDAALAALDESPALIGTSKRGDKELLIVSGEMQSPEEGALRVSYFLPDGPRGHTTRVDTAAIAAAIAENYYARLRPATEDEVIDWTTSPEFVDGSNRIAFVQAVNELGFRASQLDEELRSAARAVIREANEVGAHGDFAAAAKMVQKALAELDK